MTGSSAPQQRIGLGVDIHPFDDAKPLILGGVRLSDTHGLKGHSDADVVLHAVCDALLGALGWGDIGEWFPDTDPQWRGADSTRFVSAIIERMTKEGWRVVNCDISVIAERPKISPHRDAMRGVIAALLGVEKERVSVKATTAERLGAIGRSEGIFSQAVVLVSSDLLEVVS